MRLGGLWHRAGWIFHGTLLVVNLWQKLQRPLLLNLAPTTKAWIEARTLDTRHAVAMALLFCVALFFLRNVALQFSQSEFIYFQF
jgi:hypothetical protein